MIALLLLISTLRTSSAALATCPGSSTCPPGGIWTEWAVSGSPNCSMSCGSCATLFYTRRCVSSKAGCACSGSSTKYFPCGTETCKYPAQRTCCIPYVSMLLNGTFQCGPLPKESSPTTSCCPTGGLFTQWSKFAWSADASGQGKWTRTRECASEDAGCPCTGITEQSQVQCPCPSSLPNADYCMDGVKEPGKFNPLQIDDATCTASLDLEASNDGARYCATWTNGVSSYTFVPVIRFRIPSIETRAKDCAQDRPFDCESRKKVSSGSVLSVTFTCDLESLYWRYDYTGWLVEGYTQPIINGG